MMMDWRVFALAAQLFLTWFVPPLGVGERRLFVGDLWCFAWVGAWIVADWRNGRLGSRAPRLTALLLATLALFVVVALHGSARPSMSDAFSAVGVSLPDVAFSAGREIFKALRFTSWAWGALLVSRWRPSPSSLRVLLTSLAVASVLGMLSLLASLLLPGGKDLLAGWYLYNADVDAWRGRAYGVFSSPIEAASALGLAFLALLASRREALTLVGAASAIIGVACTKTLTPIVALLPALPLYLASGPVASRRQRLATVAVAFVAVAGLIVGWTATHPDFIARKLSDLHYRTGPWRVVAEAVFSRGDHVLLGLGLGDVPTDNSLVFLLSRGGLALLVGALWIIGAGIARGWSRWDWARRSLVVGFALSSLVLDTLILRPVVALMLAAAIPLLSAREAPGASSDPGPRRL